MTNKWCIFLLPEHKQRIAQEAIVTRDKNVGSDQSEANVQDALSDIGWDMFLSSSVTSTLGEFTDTELHSNASGHHHPYG